MSAKFMGVGVEILPFERVGSHSQTEIKSELEPNRKNGSSQSEADFSSTLQPWFGV